MVQAGAVAEQSFRTRHLDLNLTRGAARSTWLGQFELPWAQSLGAFAFCWAWGASTTGFQDSCCTTHAAQGRACRADGQHSRAWAWGGLMFMPY